MAKKSMVVDVPKGSLFYGNGYVYYNIKSAYDPAVKYTRTKRLCIGKNIDSHTMYANDNYIQLFGKDLLPDLPQRSDCLEVGTPLYLERIASDIGLDSALSAVFEPDEVNLILDLASYVLTQETDAFQHYPAYGFHHALLSDSAVSDSTISRFLSESIKPSLTEHFLDEWAQINQGSGRAYLCYDSTNINCVSEGVSLSEMGYAKDDPTKPQVNLEYVVRQRDGLPLLYKDYPGSIVDVTQCSDMIETIYSLGYQDIVVICDRGYISQGNLNAFDKAGLGFLLLLKSCDATKGLIAKYGRKVYLHSEAYIDSLDLYGITVRHRLFENKGRCRYLHIIWSQEIADKARREIMRSVTCMEKSLDRLIQKKTPLTKQDEKAYGQYFDIEDLSRTRRITSYSRNNKAIDEAVSREGFHVLVSSDEMSCEEAIKAYSKRDCVETTFRSLKTNTGMDTLRGHSNANVNGRFFILFVASILRAAIFHVTAHLREKNRKSHTVPAIIKELNKIEAVIDYKTSKYSRRYKLTAKQKSIFSCCGLTEQDIDKFIESMPSSYKS